MLPLIGLIPLLPFLGFLVCGLLGRRLPKPVITIVACGSVLGAFLLSAGAVLELRSLPAPQAEPGLGGPSYQKTYWTWLPPMPIEAERERLPRGTAVPLVRRDTGDTSTRARADAATHDSGPAHASPGLAVTGHVGNEVLRTARIPVQRGPIPSYGVRLGSAPFSAPVKGTSGTARAAASMEADGADEGAVVSGPREARIVRCAAEATIARPAVERSVADRAEEIADSSTNGSAPQEPARHQDGKEGPSFSVAWSFRLDPLSSVMILIVTGVGFLIHVYSAGYMAHDPGYARYFAYLNLFMAMMLTLVLAANFLVMFVGWEGVGLCSYLLIGFWYEDPEKAQAGRKAFITNRIGDFAFILGILAIIYWFHTVDFSEVMAAIARGGAAMEGALGAGTPGVPGVPTLVLTLIALALFIGACGKSAQIPLFVWLPDAMAGPTPVSALIHAATMVTAGVYMVARCSVLYVHAPAALLVVAIVGAATALFAATIGLAQNDIKKVLAYSTISQLGYMFLGAGVGAFAGSIFHLMTHAFFKALLFLGAGSVIHAMSNEQDLRNMGGLKERLPWTYRTMLVGALAIAGIPILSGFFSKDEILWRTWQSGHPVMWAVGAAAAALTAFYMFRLIYLAFHGGFRGTSEQAHHLHESPPSMVVPLVVLALLSIAGGWVGIPHSLGQLAGIPNYFESWLAPVLAEAPATGPVITERALEALGTGAHGAGTHGAAGSTSTGTEYAFMLLAVAIAVAGILVARAFYRRPSDLPARAAGAAGPLYGLVVNKYWVDELYDATVLRAYYRTCDAFAAIDHWVVDGIVNTVGAFTELVGQVLRFFQTGFVRNYALFVFAGAVLLVWLLGR